MNRFFYTLLFYLGLPLILARLCYRALKAPAYAKRWGERFGFGAPVAEKPVIWLHSVSVGETLASAPLVRGLLARYPDHQMLVTTMTPTGSARVRALYGDRVLHCYAPYDLPGAVARFLNRVQPALAIMMETELWPNTVAALAKRQVPIALVNARLSERSARGYAKVAKLSGPMLQRLSLVAAQHAADGQRFVDLGLPAERLKIMGSIKFDLELSDADRAKGQALRQLWLGEQVDQLKLLIAASTHKSEEQPVLEAFGKARETHPELRLLLVPRHPERFKEAAELAEQQGFKVVRRSEEQPLGDAEVILGDSMGEMMALFGAADLVFMGGSLVPTGGHNMLEPALYGLPILTGPHLFNFQEISRALLNVEGMQEVADADALAQALVALLEQPERAHAMGQAALALVAQNRGALDRVQSLLAPLLR